MGALLEPEAAAEEIQLNNSMKTIFTILMFFWASFFSFQSIAANSGCQCLCSLFYTRGGEIKLCHEDFTTKTQCKNWYFQITKTTTKKDCYLLGENLNECKGYAKEKTFQDKWSLTEGGRLHSCKLF